MRPSNQPTATRPGQTKSKYTGGYLTKFIWDIQDLTPLASRTKRGRTGLTTKGTEKGKPEEYLEANGQKWSAIPDSFQPEVKTEEAKGKEETKDQVTSQTEGGTTTQLIRDAAIVSTLKEETSISVSSSKLDTSEDEQEKARQRERREIERKMKKGLILNEDQKNEDVNITLSETDTMMMMDIPSLIVLPDQEEEYRKVEQERAKYDELCKGKIGSDNYSENSTQTFNLQTKTKEVNFDNIKSERVKVSASVWEIADNTKTKAPLEHEVIGKEFNQSIDNIIKSRLEKKKAGYYLLQAEKLEQAKLIADSELSKSMREGKGGGSTMTQSKMNISSMNAMKESSRSIISDKTTSKEGGLEGLTQGEEGSDYMETPLPDSLLRPVKIIERLLTQSLYHDQHVFYKDYPIVEMEMPKDEKETQGGKLQFTQAAFGGAEEVDKEKSAKEIEKAKYIKQIHKQEYDIRQLFNYNCDRTKGRTISAMDWNCLNHDLLAAGYGEFIHTEKAQKGLLMLWTLKNPTFPERWIETPSRITSCSFSKSNPNLIGVGDFDGGVAIYDLRKAENKPVAESMNLEGKHTDTVHQLQWVEKEKKGEVLISIGADGRVIEWSMKKGLDMTNLMTLRKQSNTSKKKNSKEGVIFNYTGGFSFDFPVDDRTHYYAATEDNAIHKCSVTYNEMPIESYTGHTGPVYKIRCNPFISNVLLTCSYDWTVKLWRETKDGMKTLTFSQPDLSTQVNDIEWSHNTSTAFGMVAEDGRLEIWDIYKDTLKPKLIDMKPIVEGFTAPARTCLRFSRTSPVVVTGNNEGVIEVFRLNGMSHVQVSTEDQRNHLVKAMAADSKISGAKGKK